MKIIQKGERTIQFPKIFINQFAIFILLGFLITILLFVSNIIAKTFSSMFGVAFFITSIIIFRIVAVIWKTDLLFQSYQIFSSTIAAFSAIIFFHDSISYGLDATLLFLVGITGINFTIIYWTDEVCKKLKIVLNKRVFDKKSILLAISLPIGFIIIYTYKSDIILLFDSHPWLATVIMVAFSIFVTFMITTRKNKKG